MYQRHTHQDWEIQGFQDEEGRGFGVVVKTLLGTPAFHIGVPGAAFDTILTVHSHAGKQHAWVLITHMGAPEWALACPSLDYCGHLGSEMVNRRSLSVCLNLPF